MLRRRAASLLRGLGHSGIASFGGTASGKPAGRFRKDGRPRGPAVVTGGAGWQQLLPEMFAVAAASQAVPGEHVLPGEQAAAGELVSVRTFEVQAPAIAGDPLGMQAEIARLARLCADEDGADVVIVGGAGLGGLAPAGAVGRRGVPVLDSVLCGLQVARESINPAPLRATRSGPVAVTVAVAPGNHNHD
jgi:hypothetical protein